MVAAAAALKRRPVKDSRRVRHILFSNSRRVRHILFSNSRCVRHKTPVSEIHTQLIFCKLKKLGIDNKNLLSIPNASLYIVNKYLQLRNHHYFDFCCTVF